MNLTAELKRRAGAAGFDAVRVARADALSRDRARLEDWLDRDRHASMHWMARDPAMRADPRRLLPGCESVVVVALNYRADDRPPGDGAGRVARYARGRDYHRVMGKRLAALAEWLEQASGRPARRFVDTAPVLERAWAERAGLGWIGKNANLLSRELGSWFLLGEILSAAELEPDRGPHEDFCGTCTACLDDCPTGAIVEPGVVDSNRCISYWTIEHRGVIPPERRTGMADWIFGCDICQDVCPWNERFAQPAAGDPLQHREDLVALDPVAILDMDEPTFRARFSGTPLMRARWDGMRRNACVVIGNSPRSRSDPAAISALGRALDGQDAVIRAHAAWALGRIGGDVARDLLVTASRKEVHPDVHRELLDAIEQTG